MDDVETSYIHNIISGLPCRIHTKNYGVALLTYSFLLKKKFEECKAWWLLDVIASHMPKVAKNEECETFHFWLLSKNGNEWLLEAKADTNAKPVISQKIDFSDFPETELPFKIYGGVTQNEGDQIVMKLYLPEEY